MKKIEKNPNKTMASKLSSVIKENNGFCIATDSNFASKKTCEDFYVALLNAMKKHPDVADYVSAESAVSYETSTLPMGLRNLGLISPELTSCRENYGDERAELESRLYAAKFYPPGSPEFAEFYTTYIRDMINDVKMKFSGQNGSNPISVVSQVSYSRLSKAVVNILLKKKPDGTDNIIRRRKAIPGSETIDENGNVSYTYYSPEEIENAEMEMYKKEDAHNFVSLDVGYVPFTFDYMFLTIASLISVKRTDRNNSIDLPTVDEILSTEGVNDPVVVEQFNEIAKIATRDLNIIDIINSRGGDIIDIIHSDCKGTEPTRPSNNNLTIREIYINILMYVRIILFMGADLIRKIQENSNNPSVTNRMIDLLLGIEMTEDADGFMELFEGYISNEKFIGMLSQFPLLFKINEHLFRILLVNLVKRATISVGGKTQVILDKFIAHIGYLKETTGFSAHISNFIRTNDVESSIIDTAGIINSFRGVKEPMISYAYRTTQKYLNPENGVFGIELAVIDSSTKIVESLKSGKKSTATRYNMFDNGFTFDIDSLIETVKKLSGIESITEDTPPFKIYKDDILKKTENLNEKRKRISEYLDETYGRSVPKFFIKIPSIPYDENEVLWARNKCIELNAHIGKIREINPVFDWNLFRESLVTMTAMSEDLAESDIEDPTMIARIAEAKTIFDTLSKESGLDDSNLVKLITFEKDLLYYSNLPKIKFGFEKFRIETNKNIGLEMNFKIGKNSILVNGAVRSVQSMIGNPDFITTLDGYFRPFFESFATINVQAFDINFAVVERQVKQKKAPGMITKDNAMQLYSDVVMTVKFGSTEDIQMCAKFRSKFFSILNSDKLLIEAKKDLGIPIERTDFSFNEVPEKFRIGWDRTSEQHAAYSSKTYKIYDDARGCKEKYPFYDNSGSNIVKKSFEIVSQRYNQTIERRKNGGRKPGSGGFGPGDFGPGLGKVDGSKARQDAFDFWSAKTKDGDSVSIVNSTLSDTGKSSSVTDKSKSLFGKKSDRRDTKGTGRQSVNTGLQMVDQQPAEINQIFTRRMKKTLVEDSENIGFMKVTYAGKTVRGYISKNGGEKSNESTNSGTPSTRYNKTPSRFEGGLRERKDRGSRSYSRGRPGDNRRNNNGFNRGNSSERSNRHNSHGRKSTPSGFSSIGSGNKGSPISRDDNTPNSQSNRLFTTSPSTNKRGGVQIGTQSPNGGQSPSFMQPGLDIFTNLPPIPVQTGNMGFYPTQSPLPDHGRSYFGSENGTPRANTDKSDKSEGAKSTSSVLPPVQTFHVDEDDEAF